MTKLQSVYIFNVMLFLCDILMTKHKMCDIQMIKKCDVCYCGDKQKKCDISMIKNKNVYIIMIKSTKCDIFVTTTQV